MRIGQLAARAGTSVKTIRYYDRVDMLRPERRSEAGYRLYGEDALDRYRFVRAAQAVGLSLGEIREVLALRDHGETPCGFVIDLIWRRADELDARIAELIALRDELGELRRRAPRLDPRDCAPGLVCHVITAPLPRSATSCPTVPDRRLRACTDERKDSRFSPPTAPLPAHATRSPAARGGCRGAWPCRGPSG